MGFRMQIGKIDLDITISADFLTWGRFLYGSFKEQKKRT